MPDVVPVTIVVRSLAGISRIDRADAEQAVDAADDTADDAPDDAADRPGSLSANRGAMGRTVRNALGMRRDREGE
jgi:hypothetical protein